jgi:oligo-1,6-glucosidase
VKDELFNMINWWLEKGLAGFRIDAIINIKKDTSFPSYEPDGSDGLVDVSRMVDEVSGVGELLQEMKQKTFDRFQAFTVAEVFNMKDDELNDFIGEEGHFSTMFDFSAEITTGSKNGWYDAKTYDFDKWKDATFASQLKCREIGFLANIIENHDQPRGVNTYLPEYAQGKAGIKILATINTLLRGIPFIYQGQEIGMRNCRMESINEYDDIATKDQYKKAIEAGLTNEEALEVCYLHSRDNARTPMQWNDGENAGFTEGKPWLKINPNYTEINVESQTEDEDSILRYYKKLIALRKSEKYGETFTYGDFIPAYMDYEKTYAFYRKLEKQNILVAANLGENEISLELEYDRYELLLTNMDTPHNEGRKIILRPCEVLVLNLLQC